MTLQEFEKLVEKHSLFPGNELYNSNAFVGEAGEVANQVKKIHILKSDPSLMADPNLTLSEFESAKVNELGDALFYLVRNILDSGYTVAQIMQGQAIKVGFQSDGYGKLFKK